MLKIIVLGLIGLFVAFAVWVRLAPTDAAFWHNPQLPVMSPGEYPSPDSFVSQRAVEGDGAETLASLDAIIRATPRTIVFAGALDAGKITYVTRSRVMGFPDYTTVTLASLAPLERSTLQVFGRLRFGKSDMGVNRTRIQGWLGELDARTGTGTPTQ
jgi:hypothetical protein